MTVKAGEIHQIGEARIRALRDKHAALDRALEEENKRPLPNQGEVYSLAFDHPAPRPRTT